MTLLTILNKAWRIQKTQKWSMILFHTRYKLLHLMCTGNSEMKWRDPAKNWLDRFT